MNDHLLHACLNAVKTIEIGKEENLSSRICVIIPAFNAAKTIRNVIDGARKHVTRVIVADDGSADETAVIAREAGAEVVTIPANYGKGHALKLLFRRAIKEGFDAAISMDADGQHDPDEIPLFIKAFEHNLEEIIIGSRMHDRENIPQARLDAMRIARFYVSLAANQPIEDTQCGYRLYPLSLIKKIELTSERYITETELLIKAGDMGKIIRCVRVRALYGENGSHFRPVMDIVSISAWVISYLIVKWFKEGITSGKPFTYSKNNLRDRIGKHKGLDRLFVVLTVLIGLPTMLFFLAEYILLSPFLDNFSIIRRSGNFYRITLATFTLFVFHFFSLFERLLLPRTFHFNFLDEIVEHFFGAPALHPPHTPLLKGGEEKDASS
ncbi:MAG: glycosyltransferase family 2 protein [Acidobacteriota bacterium]